MGAVVALVAGSALAAEVGVSEREILIGQSITLLDGKHAYGTAVAKGVRVYLDRVNAEGGVYGRKINVRRLDDQGELIGSLVRYHRDVGIRLGRLRLDEQVISSRNYLPSLIVTNSHILDGYFLFHMRVNPPKLLRQSNIILGDFPAKGKEKQN